MPAPRSIRAPATSSFARWSCYGSSASKTGCVPSRWRRTVRRAASSLAGRELAIHVKELNEGVEGFSPPVRVFINQDALEPLLHERALELWATVRNRTEAVVAQHHHQLSRRLRRAAARPQSGRLLRAQPEAARFFRLDRTGGDGFLVINTVGEDVTQDSAVDVQAGLTQERARL